MPDLRRTASLALILAFVALSIGVSVFCLWVAWQPCVGPGCFPEHGEPRVAAPMCQEGGRLTCCQCNGVRFCGPDREALLRLCGMGGGR